MVAVAVALVLLVAMALTTVVLVWAVQAVLEILLILRGDWQPHQVKM